MHILVEGKSKKGRSFYVGLAHIATVKVSVVNESFQ